MFFTIFEMKQRPNLFYCNDKPIVSELYRQHSIFQATFSFDLKRHAFKLLLDAKKLIQLWIRLGYKAERFPYVSTQKMRNIVNPWTLSVKKRVAQYLPKMDVLNHLRRLPIGKSDL